MITGKQAASELQRSIGGPGAAVLHEWMKAGGFVPIPLASFMLEDGTIMTKQTSTVVGHAQLSNKESVIMIPINAGTEAVNAVVPLPPDLDAGQDVKIHVLAGKSADNDALTLDAEAFFCAVGDVANADAQDTAAQTIVAGVSELVFVCGNDGVLAPPSSLSIVLTQGGTNDGDAVYIYSVWLEYIKG